ncbi:Small G protein signaling modulator 1 [Manis javanica]|nr:Small G protein signaling modulator 1 [Manis javanica]
MVDVVQHSTQYMSDADLLAIGTYLKSLPAGKNDLPCRWPRGRGRSSPRIRRRRFPCMRRPPPRQCSDVPADLYASRGGLGYLQFCADCHRADGGGVKDVSAAGRQFLAAVAGPVHADPSDAGGLEGARHAAMRGR